MADLAHMLQGAVSLKAAILSPPLLLKHLDEGSLSMETYVKLP